jgi:hypothetical protein
VKCGRMGGHPHGGMRRLARSRPHQLGPHHWRRTADREHPHSRNGTAAAPSVRPSMGHRTNSGAACLCPLEECPERPMNTGRSRLAPAETGASRPVPRWPPAKERPRRQHSVLKSRISNRWGPLMILRYAARFVSARRIHLAIAVGLAPMRSKDLTKRSRETD